MDLSLDFIQIDVGDWQRAIDWYTDVFDLRPGFRDDEYKWCELLFPDGRFGIALRGVSTLEEADRRRLVPDIRTEDLDGTIGQMKQRGAKFVQDVKEGRRKNGQGYRWIKLQDPEGNLFRLYEWT